MNAPEAFGVAVRTVGLLIMLHGFWYLLYAVLATFHLASEPEEGNPIKDYWSAAVWFLTMGGALLAGADTIVKSAY